MAMLHAASIVFRLISNVYWAKHWHRIVPGADVNTAASFDATPTMPLPRLQFTVRRMMIVVAIAAVALGANDLRRRKVRYDALRSTHEWRGRSSMSLAELHASTVADNEREVERLRAAVRSRHEAPLREAELVAQIISNIGGAAAIERAAERQCRSRARFHELLRKKYERAARYPWLIVEPDPPEPD
jgi:hypothetical protein